MDRAVILVVVMVVRARRVDVLAVILFVLLFLRARRVDARAVMLVTVVSMSARRVDVRMGGDIGNWLLVRARWVD